MPEEIGVSRTSTTGFDDLGFSGKTWVDTGSSTEHGATAATAGECFLVAGSQTCGRGGTDGCAASNDAPNDGANDIWTSTSTSRCRSGTTSRSGDSCWTAGETWRTTWTWSYPASCGVESPGWRWHRTGPTSSTNSKGSGGNLRQRVSTIERRKRWRCGLVSYRYQRCSEWAGTSSTADFSSRADGSGWTSVISHHLTSKLLIPHTSSYTQLISHNSTHTIRLTQPISHHSSRTIHLTPLISQPSFHTIHLTPCIAQNSSNTTYSHNFLTQLSHTTCLTSCISPVMCSTAVLRIFCVFLLVCCFLFLLRYCVWPVFYKCFVSHFFGPAFSCCSGFVLDLVFNWTFGVFFGISLSAYVLLSLLLRHYGCFVVYCVSLLMSCYLLLPWHCVWSLFHRCFMHLFLCLVISWCPGIRFDHCFTGVLCISSYVLLSLVALALCLTHVLRVFSVSLLMSCFLLLLRHSVRPRFYGSFCLVLLQHCVCPFLFLMGVLCIWHCVWPCVTGVLRVSSYVLWSLVAPALCLIIVYWRFVSLFLCLDMSCCSGIVFDPCFTAVLVSCVSLSTCILLSVVAPALCLTSVFWVFCVSLLMSCYLLLLRHCVWPPVLRAFWCLVYLSLLKSCYLLLLRHCVWPLLFGCLVYLSLLKSCYLLLLQHCVWAPVLRVFWCLVYLSLLMSCYLLLLRHCVWPLFYIPSGSKYLESYPPGEFSKRFWNHPHHHSRTLGFEKLMI